MEIGDPLLVCTWWRTEIDGLPDCPAEYYTEDLIINVMPGDYIDRNYFYSINLWDGRIWPYAHNGDVWPIRGDN